jgi:stearoyl-CoA desaturase (delta-9 desaturase)
MAAAAESGMSQDVSEAVPGAPAPVAELAPVDATRSWVGVASEWIYWGIHASCLFAFMTGVSGVDIALCLATFYLRLFAITGGYHRYFSHKAYKTSRVFQFVLAAVGCMSIQKGPLWWAGGHRRHHRYSDQEGDMHSPDDGFWYSHTGWIFDGRWDATETDRIRDFARFPELVWLNHYHAVPPVLLAIACFAIGGWSGLVWGMAISTTLLWHSTYTINSLAHRWGSRRYETTDGSRNNGFLALLTLGEGWHNNHHKYMASARQGFFWWEIDITYYVLRGLALVGIVWDLREPPASVLDPAAHDAVTR